MKFTIHQRKSDKIYYAEKMYKGERHYFSSKDKKEVEKQLIEFERNKRKNIILESTPMTVSQWSNKWLDMYKKNVTKNTYDMYQNTIKQYIIPRIGAIKLVDIKQSHIISILNDMGNISRSKEITLLTIKQILDKAVENDYIPKNVAHGIKLNKTIKKEKAALSEELIQIIKEIIEKHPDLFIFYFMIYTGLRSGEVVAIKGKNINLKNKTLLVDCSYDFKHKEIKSVKNGEERIIPLFDIILPFLKLLDIKKDNYIFKQANGNIMSYEVIKRKLDKLKKYIEAYYNEKELPIPSLNFTSHTFRHTYACLLYKAGITAKQAQKWTGHKEINVLLNIYTHLDEKDNQGAIEKVNSFIQSA